MKREMVRAIKWPWKLFRKWAVFFEGLTRGIAQEFTIAWKVVVSVAVVTLSYYLHPGGTHFFIVLLATSQMVTAELFNSALEEIADFVQPERDRHIKAAKDFAATACGITILVWFCIVAYEVLYVALAVIRR